MTSTGLLPTVTVGSATIPYRVTGAGSPLVLVHGTGPGAGITYDHLVDRFTARHAVVLPDLSGSAAATDDGGELTLELLAEQVAAVLEAATPEAPADLVGFSLGAPVAAAVAALAPQRVRRLVLIAGWPGPDEQLRETMTLWRRMGELDAELFGRFATLTGFGPAHLGTLGPDGMAGAAGNMPPTPGILRQVALNAQVDVRALLPRIRARTLVIGCTHDAIVPVRHARALHLAIAGAHYTEFDSGHLVIFERPAELADRIAGFLDDA